MRSSVLLRALGLFKACSRHTSGIADVTSMYKRNAAHMPLVVCVLSSVDLFAISVCLRDVDECVGGNVVEYVG